MDLADYGPVWAQLLREQRPSHGLLDAPMLRKDTVQGLLPARKAGLLVAAGETGKTTHVIARAIAIATGKPCFGRPALQGTWVLLSFDDAYDELCAAVSLSVQAMHRQGLLTRDEVALVERHVVVQSLRNGDGVPCPNFNAMVDGRAHATTFADELTEYLSRLPKPLRGFTLDTYRHFAGATANDDMAAVNTIGGMTQVAEALECTAECIAHTGKQNFRDGVTDLYSASGTAVLGDNSRFVNVLQRATWADVRERIDMTGKQRGYPMVVTPARGSIVTPRGEPLFYWRDGWRFGAIEGEPKTAERREDERDREVLSAIRRGAETKTAIYGAVGGKKQATLDRIDGLIDRGHIGSQDGSRKLALTGSGARLLDAQT